MCVIHISSSSDSFDSFLENHPELPVYQKHNKHEAIGEYDEASHHPDYGFSCVVSDKLVRPSSTIGRYHQFSSL